MAFNKKGEGFETFLKISLGIILFIILLFAINYLVSYLTRGV